ncbi:30S ribosomal protein S16 [Salibacteraceae bacterium]|nr:30S ribosomal protein S16 [Salibacteraceae bacterium]MDB4105829.1 30S ribosomal protein S16 [Salibacteraceae bacterium]HAQ70913.1 30S ribosomal protein S16 [Flavobacteriales bacterium]
MATRIRLQRHGKKGKPFFHIVVADTRAKRDGRFIEKLGIYNPNTDPATIDLDFDRTLAWVQKGAQPSDTARAILKYQGVMMKDHLIRGIAKGALTEEQVEAKFSKWLEDKTALIDSKKGRLDKAKNDAKNAALAAEKAVNDARSAAQQAVVDAANAVEETVVEVVEATEAAAEAAAETAEAVVEKVEEVAEEAAPEAEAPKAESTEEAAPETEEKKED